MEHGCTYGNSVNMQSLVLKTKWDMRKVKQGGRRERKFWKIELITAIRMCSDEDCNLRTCPIDIQECDNCTLQFL